MKIVTILGARPQFIKAGTVSREILRQQKNGVNIVEIIVHTGQHYDGNMSDVFFDEMQIPKPAYFLGIGGKTHGAMTGQMIEKIEQVLVDEKPDWLMIYGDTNTTLAAAISAVKLQIKIAHIEAGLRSFNMNMPEEINRILTDRVSSILFCPTQAAMDNLSNEAVQHWDTQVVLSGDVMLDGALFYRGLAQQPRGIEVSSDFVLSTIHRPENTDCPKRLANILLALNEIAKHTQVILPLHPRTKKSISQDNYATTNLSLIEPVGYLNMVWLLNNCSKVMTDSGGLQKEAFFFKKPCITLRNETEWVELVDSGYNILAGADIDAIINAYNNSCVNKEFSENFYGDGNASRCIVNALIRYGSH